MTNLIKIRLKQHISNNSCFSHDKYDKYLLVKIVRNEKKRKNKIFLYNNIEFLFFCLGMDASV